MRDYRLSGVLGKIDFFDFTFRPKKAKKVVKSLNFYVILLMPRTNFGIKFKIISHVRAVI